MAIYIPTPPPQASFAAPSNHVYGAAASFPSIPCRRPLLVLCCQLSDHQTAPQVAVPSRPVTINRSLLSVSATSSEAELWAAACLRVRTFYDFNEQTFGIEDHKRYLAEREFEALKERVAGKRKGFRKVSCINATLPISCVVNVSTDLCSSCKFSQNGEDRVVVGTLDLNQCVSLPDEIVGMKPQGIGSDFARAYISNVCVAEELQRNGLGYELIAESKSVAEDWGISDLYVHVAVNNEPAKNLYIKSGFTLESDEPAWQARFLDRPRRLLLWTALPITYTL
ncbi:Acyl-CoA N-acyltransferases superfamily protein [Perilla frutescens var. hirtella]|uniref:Acyl-CoA N-acyltransferases superfamily protein n=1 Tax=Perilla frutescens var. hirtella TaxID=608512 RepID=A0AAD4P3R1_PERFH|nr:Acyl-CoA N-acyltransferases superfamily protein [Perilla frutescens var. hirtella]KAH6825101.1 Acyl-CoA N-acyltransferases superfamily protein [Perilla frutescens var. hirtella]